MLTSMPNVTKRLDPAHDECQEHNRRKKMWRYDASGLVEFGMRMVIEYRFDLI